MKALFAAAVTVFILALAQASYAQTANAQAQAGAQSWSNSTSASGAQSNNQIIFNTPSNTTAEIKNVPSINAPSLGGGGHPCLAAVSGSASVLGGGLGLGKSDAEVVCMLSFLGQNEAAIRALVAKSPRACKAIENVGYYVVPLGNGRTKAVAFRCKDKTVRGGIYTSQAVGVGQATGSVSSRSAAPTTSLRPVPRPEQRVESKPPWLVCEKRTEGIYIKYRAGKKSPAAKAACLKTLGY